VGNETALLAAGLLRACGAITMVGCLPDNLQNFSSKPSNARSWHSANVWTPSIMTRSSSSCLSMVALREMALRSWLGFAGSVMASSCYQDKVRPRCRPCQSNNVYYSNRGKGTGRQAGSGQAEVGNPDRGKDTGWQAGSGRVVRRACSGSGQARVKNQEGDKKRLGKDRS
jgi:hypothetical protein